MPEIESFSTAIMVGRIKMRESVEETKNNFMTALMYTPSNKILSNPNKGISLRKRLVSTVHTFVYDFILFLFVNERNQLLPNM